METLKVVQRKSKGEELYVQYVLAVVRLDDRNSIAEGNNQSDVSQRYIRSKTQ